MVDPCNDRKMHLTRKCDAKPPMPQIDFFGSLKVLPATMQVDCFLDVMSNEASNAAHLLFLGTQH